MEIKIWPPKQSTRLTIVDRITENLSIKLSTLTLKYGGLTKEEAAENAKEIEDNAFNTAKEFFEKEPHGDGSSAIRVYATECNKKFLEVLKMGSRSKEEAKETVKSRGSTVPQGKCFDISQGKRGFIEEEEAQELLRPLKERGNSFTKICFSNRSFGLGATHVAKPILESIKDHLEEVDLSNFVAGRPEDEALQVMKIFSAALEGSALRSLDLSNNLLGEKGVRAFEKLLKSQSCLEKLFLINNAISKEAAQAVYELIPSTQNLKVLHIHNNNITRDEADLAIAKIVKRSPLLEDFQCSSTWLGSDGGIALCKALENCAHLKRLDLRDNMLFGVEAGKSLAKTIRKCGNLIEEIYLSYLNLEDEGAMAIADALKESCPLLKVLDMAGNCITAEAAPSLADCIIEKEHLVKLILSENELKDEGATEISAAFWGNHHVSLKEVDMSINALSWAGAWQLAQAVVGKPGLELLNLDGNFITYVGVDELKSIFEPFPGVLGSIDENAAMGRNDDDDDIAPFGNDLFGDDTFGDKDGDIESEEKESGDEK